MKLLTTIIILATAIIAVGQTHEVGKFNYKMLGIKTVKERNIFYTTASCFFVSGLVRGLNETLIYDYATFEKKFPNANQMWWNPAKSWNNSYPKGLLFQTALIAPKDAKHTFDFVMNNLLYVTIPIQYLDRKNLVNLPIKYIALRWISLIAVHSIGFEAIHKGVFKL